MDGRYCKFRYGRYGRSLKYLGSTTETKPHRFNPRTLAIIEQPPASNVLRMNRVHLQSENEDSDFLAELWKDGLAEYRRTVQLNKADETFFQQLLPLDAQLGTVMSEWAVFRNQNPASRRKTCNRVGNVLNNVILSLHEKVSALDVLIAFPTQAVRKVPLNAADVQYRYFHPAQRSGQHFEFFYPLPRIEKTPTT